MTQKYPDNTFFWILSPLNDNLSSFQDLFYQKSLEFYPIIKTQVTVLVTGVWLYHKYK